MDLRGLGRLLALPENIRPGYTETNHYSLLSFSISVEEKIYNIKPRVNVINLFSFITDDEA